jgi:outer membrane protein assembly factor BamD (BamD/ComL family)
MKCAQGLGGFSAPAGRAAGWVLVVAGMAGARVFAEPASFPAAGNASLAAAVVVAPVPLTLPAPDAAAEAEAAEWAAGPGRDALQAGLPELAKDLFREALARPGLTPGARDALNLDLATACLALGQLDEAKAALDAVGDTDAAPYALRAALLAATRAQGETDPAQAAAEAQSAAAWLGRIAPAGPAPGNLSWVFTTSAGGTVANALPAADQPWYYFTRGLLAEENHDPAAARAFWQQACDAAVTPLQKAQFEAVLWRGQIMTGEATPELAETLRQRAATYQGQSAGVPFAKEYAIVLDQLGEKQQALDYVTQLLKDLPNEDRDDQDSVHLLYALLDRDDPAAIRGALQDILRDRGDRDTQEVALSLLERDPDGLQQILDELIAAPHGHPLMEQLLLLQAQLALSQGHLDAAAASANRLLDEFPASAWRQDALLLLAYVAYHSEPPHYRVAADYINQIRTLTTDAAAQARFSSLLADLYFLNGDYQNAADLYKALLANPAAATARGALLRRAVQSEILAQNLDEAIAELNGATAAGAGGGIDPLDRWRAEWNVLEELRNQGREAEAFARLDQLLTPAEAPPPELRLRLLWLAARLAVDVRDPSAAARAAAFEQAVDALQPDQATAGVDPALRDQLAANALLVRGQADFLAGQTDEGRQLFAQLRTDYPGSDPALYSIFFEASDLANKGRTAEAEGLMNNVADKYPQSEYAPLARYQAALYAEARGQYDAALSELANFAAAYKDDKLLYEVRQLQGDIERKSNDFAAALDVYDLMLSEWPDDPRRPRTELARADCLFALASQDPARREDALNAYERLFNLPNLPADARVEAGFTWGYMLGQDKDYAEAEKVYFTVVSRFLLDPPMAASLGTGGRYFMSRCLFGLADIYEQQNQFDDARRCYELVQKYRLLGQALAADREKMRPVTAPPPAPPPAQVGATPTS